MYIYKLYAYLKDINFILNFKKFVVHSIIHNKNVIITSLFIDDISNITIIINKLNIINLLYKLINLWLIITVNQKLYIVLIK